MRYFEIIESRLDEGRDAPLYHGAGLASAISILKENEIWASTQQHKTAMAALGVNHMADKTDTEFGVSLSRDIRISRNFGEVVFELDQRKLAQRYKIIPFDYWTASNPKGQSVRAKGPNAPGDRYEAEEFLIGSITPLNRYLIAIHLTQKVFDKYERDFPKHAAMVLYHPLLKVDGRSLKEIS